MGQHPGIFKSTQFENHKKGWVNITGMVGQHETERWVNMKRNLQLVHRIRFTNPLFLINNPVSAGKSVCNFLHQ